MPAPPAERWEAARGFLMREGRLVERRLFAALFEGGATEGVVEALRGYRNADGGFGHGLEPDTRSPHSQPLDVQIALELLDAAGAGPAGLALPACDFIASVAAPSGAVPVLLPTIAGYPRASHWQETDRYEPGLNPTAAIVAVLHRLGARHAWLDDGTEYCFVTLERAGPPVEAHAIRCVLAFLESSPDRVRAEALVEAVAKALGSSTYFRSDPDDPTYGLPPTDFAPQPSSRWRALFDDDLFDAHLDRLERDQQADGGWPVTWQPPSDASTLAWRGIKTLQALRVLHAYGRLAAPEGPR